MVNIIVIIGCTLFAAFFLLNILGGKNNFSKEDVIGIIERFINGTSINNEWDDFECVPFANSYLEKIRERCAELPQKFPAKGKYCSEEGLEVMKSILKELSESKG